MPRRTVSVVLALLLLSVTLAGAIGCGREQSAGEQGSRETTQPTSGKQTPSTGAAIAVTMNGRSVMGGWMQHWGFAWEGPVRKNGYVFDYKELDASDIGNMPGSFAKNVAGLPAGSIAFYKFCFADFSGDNLSTLEGIIDKVVETAKERNLRLIIGNALPVHKQDSPPGVVAEYRKYNAFLEKTAASNTNVWIYDLYGVLAGPDGYLKPAYDSGDSHPNNEGYQALDQTFFPFLSTIVGGKS